MKKLIILIICLLISGCINIMKSDKIEVLEIKKSISGKCQYTVSSFIADTIIEDDCGKYNIGDKLVITKEIKK